MSSPETSLHPLPLIQSPLGESNSDDQITGDADPAVATGDASLYSNPQFNHYEETSNIQLFFDLFFVANLSSFTSVTEVTGRSHLTAYVGFFSILWFTWFQVTLYDVRFSTDSVFERIAHACHFGVMVGLSVVGPQFGGVGNTQAGALQTLSLIFMVSRIVLMIQYSSTLVFVWKFPKSRMPLILIVGSLFITSMIYLGISFAFSVTHVPDAYIAWYFCSAFESGVQIAVARHWDVVSFAETHLTERMTCLTLIILGEGVVGLTRSIVKIIDLDYNFSSAAIGNLTAAVLIIFLLYMIYFDNVPTGIHEKNSRQLWTVTHFPLHVALVLLMEALNQMINWQHIVEYLNIEFEPLLNVYAQLGSVTEDVVQDTWNETINSIVDQFMTTFDDYSEIQHNLLVLSPSENTTASQRKDAAQTLQAELFKIVFDGYDFEPPDSSETETISEALNTYGGVFDFIFVYFFVCAGLVLILLSVLSFLTLLPHFKFREHRRQLFSIVCVALLGLGLTLLSTMVLTDAAGNLGASRWALAVVALVLLAALVLNYVPRGAIVVGGPGRTTSKGFGNWRSREKGENDRRPARVGTGF